MLLAAFLAWMFAGLGIALFILIHRQMMLDLLGRDAEEKVIARWFAWFQAAFLFGAAAGGWIFGSLGDRIGRTRAMAISVVWQSAFTLCCYPATTPEALLCFRFLASMGIGGIWPNAVALVAEAWPDVSRPFLAGLLGAAANVGQVLMGVLGLTFDVTPEAWRWTLVPASLPAIVGFWTLLVVPESVRWQRAKSQRVETNTNLRPIREVLTPPLLSRTLLGICLGAIPVIGTAANGNWLVPWTDQANQQRVVDGEIVAKPDPKSKARTQIVRSAGGILGSLLGGIVAAVIGRRLSYFLISLGAMATSTYIFTQLDPLHPTFPYWVFALGFVGIVYFGWLPLFLPELFPTHVRSTGSGISFNTGRIVSGLVVLSAGVLLELVGGSYARVGFATGLIYGVGMIIIWFAPRKSKGLED
ncbi:MAG: MFS transporter [Gemmataceae bacterium]|nr:MFS transporter [Gemmataceae bacterium]